MKQITAFKCDFCGKKLERKHAMVYHELICSKNPENKRACFGCKFLGMKEDVVFIDQYNGTGERIVFALFCKKKDIYVYPPKVEIKGNMLDLDNEPMPKECDLFEVQELIQ